MRFTKTIDLWASGVTSAILNGNLKLQCGQWVKCGDKGAPARFVKTTGQSIWVAHSEGEDKTTKSFARLCSDFYLHKVSRNK